MGCVIGANFKSNDQTKREREDNEGNLVSLCIRKQRFRNLNNLPHPQLLVIDFCRFCSKCEIKYHITAKYMAFTAWEMSLLSKQNLWYACPPNMSARLM
jgi:hypothetical protein